REAAPARLARRRSHRAGRADRACRAGGRIHVSLPLEVVLLLLIWGMFVGLDLVSLPQMMIARPLVAGTVAGAILGDIPTGLKLGVVFELLQFDILPVGAVRYPEYGPATIAAVATALAAGTAGTLRLVGRGRNLAWFLAGLGGGILVAWLR